ncbi:hypothetical protein DB32_004527 [Sandaracinus amylolyticus]|uniref:Phosphatidic acid phosphatase type 2/haloperoxidase domain-containing protein n=1 Tax=Sandaracinus amylolyticus TaxID=927083 RepID=A0A0F6YKK0_9BACT|nr:hypothetical protein DB32_004527 [Sandaracinus amylolyticus]
MSIVGHPVVVVPSAIVLATTGQASLAEAGAVLGTVLVAMAVIGAYLAHGVRTGRLSHIDVSRREERGTFYLVSILATGGAALALNAGGAPRGAVIGCACGCAVFLAGSVANRVIKASLHTAFPILAAAIAAPPIARAAFLVAALAIAWSRIALGRHTAREVIAGGAIGAGAALAFLALA